METPKQLFHKYPTRDPKNGKEIEIGSTRYNRLVEKYGSPKIKSPKSHYKITVGKKAYYTLIENGYTQAELLGYETNVIPKNDIKNDIKNNIKNDVNFVSLPADIINEIINTMEPYEFVALVKVSKYLKNIISKNVIYINFIKNFKTISCGNQTTFFIKDEALYAYGDNHRQHDLTNGCKTAICPIPQKVIGMSYTNVLSVISGGSHTSAITSDGVFIFGYNGYGQLGLGDRNDHRLPQKLNLSNILQIVCSRNFTLILTKAGVYGFGDHYDGQLGLGKLNNLTFEDRISIPTRVPIPSKVLFIAASSTASYFITEDGIYTCGESLMSNRGHCNYVPIKLDTHFITNYKKVIIYCGSRHVIINDNNVLYGFGSNINGELGLSHIGIIDKITQLSYFNNFSFLAIIDIACGENYSLVLTNEGLFGMGIETITHTRNQIKHYTIQKIELDNIVSIYAGVNHFIIKTQEGVYGMGDNSRKQIDNTTVKMYRKPHKINL
jgi:alpha-tubulin suppressor-like RCC1 family protein